MELKVNLYEEPETNTPHDLMDYADTKLDEMQVALKLASRLVMELDNHVPDQVFNRKAEEISVLLDGLWEFRIPMIRGIIQEGMNLTEST